jgi:hypothetical protein
MAVATSLAVAGIAAGVGGAVMSANAQKSAARRAANSQDKANQLNYAQYLQSRGYNVSGMLSDLGIQDPTGGAQSAILPGYAPEGTEQAMFQQALDSSKAIGQVPPETTLEQFKSIIAGQMPAIMQGNDFIGSIYDGRLDEQRAQNFDPVAEARLQAAQANGSAIDTALAEERNRINAEGAAQGFVGGGSFANNRLLEATTKARQAQAGVMGGTNVQNAEDRNRLDESGIAMRLQSLDAAPNRAKQLIQLGLAPEQAVAEKARLAQQPFDFFRVGAGNPPQVQPLPVSSAPPAGAIALTGIGQTLGTAANAWTTNQAANNMSNFTRMNSSGATPSNFGSMTPAQQAEYASMWSSAQKIPQNQLGFGE